MTFTTLFSSAALIVISAASSLAQAGITKSAGHWQGQGVRYTLAGAPTGTFDIELTNTPVNSKTVITNGTITLSNGVMKTFTQTMTDKDNGSFAITSPDRNGSGVSLGDGVIEVYVEGKDKSDAITIMFNKDMTSYRALVTELANGKAVDFIRETLHKSAH